MYRYITLIWNENDSQAADTAKFLEQHFMGTATDWSTAYSGAGLRVLHTGEEKNRMQAYPINPRSEGCGGVVLGKLFDRAKSPDVIPGNAELSVPEARKVVESKGRHLVDDYWGTYVAFFQDETKKHVLVDPIGTFSCFSTHHRGVEIYCTYMPDIADCEFLNFSINWIPAIRSVWYGFERAKTGLNEVDKILPGQCVTISPWSREKTFYWNPQKISQTDVIESLAEAEEALRQTLLTNVAAQVAPYDNVFHQLGGLDSSIIASCLKNAPSDPDITCVNIFHNSPMGDERYYTRKTANHIGVPLIEYPESTEHLDFNAILDTPKVSLPYFHAQHMGFERDLSRITAENGGQAIFSGIGGDEILYSTKSSYGAIDYIRAHGLRPTLLRLIVEAARIQNLSVWSILPKIVREGFSHQPWNFFNEFDIGKATLFTEDIQAQIEPNNTAHPWIEQKYGVPPGKLDHIVSYTMGTYDRECKTHPNEHILRIDPMLAQPVIETCLRIPSWVMTAEGKTRGLARKAFQQYLPTEVVWRESKMAFNFYGKSIIRENVDFLREFLLDGVLVSDNVGSKSNLEKTLAMDHDCGAQDGLNIKWFLDAEIWARKWRGETSTSIVRSDAA